MVKIESLLNLFRLSILKLIIKYTYYALTFVLALICYFADHELISYPVFQLIALFSPYLFFIAAISALIYGFRKRFDVAIWFGICMFFTWDAFGTLFNLNFSESFMKSPEYEVRVLSLNAAQLQYTEDNIVDFAEEVNKYNADIICLQEIGIKNNWQQKHEVGLLMAKAFGMPYFSFSRNENNIYGLAIFSKFKIEESVELYLPVSQMNGILKYNILTPKNKKLTLFNTHLSSFNLSGEEDKSLGHMLKILAEQQEQVDIVNENISNKNATILLGDLNSPPYLHTYKSLKGDLKDSFDYTHWNYGSTLNNLFLPFRIDLHLHNDYIKCVEFKNISNTISDHKIQWGVYEVY